MEVIFKNTNSSRGETLGRSDGIMGRDRNYLE